jgi:hypothetical protein
MWNKEKGVAMERVLTKASAVCCKHLGTVQTSDTSPLQVNGSAVLVLTSILNQPIAGCQTMPPPSTNVKCFLVTSISGGSAQKLKVSGQPVMLQTLAGMTNGVVNNLPQSLEQAQAKQDLLRAN